MRIVHTAFLLFAMLAPRLLAQTPGHQGTIPAAPSKHSGTSLTIVVSDENSLVVPDAVLLLTDPRTGAALRVQTDVGGGGRLVGLDPDGTFTMRAEQSKLHRVT